MEEIIGPLLLIFLALVILYYAFAVYWYVTFPLLIIGWLVYDALNKQRKVREEQDRQREEQERRAAAQQAARAQHRAAQTACLAGISRLNDVSIAAFELLPDHLTEAEEQLDSAASNYQEGVFAPFWDSIEQAVNALGRFDADVDRIRSSSGQYRDLVAIYEGTPPSFPVSLQSTAKLQVAAQTANRLHGLVRKAQANFQFAVIYEQRRTNQILFRGFGTLAQAMDNMTYRISESLGDLAASVEANGEAMRESMDAMSSGLERIEAAAESMVEHQTTERAERKEREEKVVEMLDNIQRRRKPMA